MSCASRNPFPSVMWFDVQLLCLKFSQPRKKFAATQQSAGNIALKARAGTLAALPNIERKMERGSQSRSGACKAAREIPGPACW